MRTKQLRYNALAEDDRMVEPDKPLFTTIKGKRNDMFFHNSNPIVLELACGRGEYTIGLAKEFPDHNFIGIDKKGERMRCGLQDADESCVTNI
jgi:tRNA (guanine-N7-)-methyltransferase